MLPAPVPFKGIVRTTLLRTGALAVVLAILLLAARVFSWLGWLALPFVWPSIIILGADELQETYGYWGEPAIEWLLSIPWLMFLALAYGIFKARQENDVTT